MPLLPLTSNTGCECRCPHARLLSFQCLCMRFNFSQAAFSPLHKQSVGGLLSTSLVAKWTFLCVAPLAFALTNTGALTRGWGPRQGSGWTDESVHGQCCVCAVYSIYICMHQQTYTLSLLLVFFFFCLVIQTIHSFSLPFSHVFVSHQYMALCGV